MGEKKRREAAGLGRSHQFNKYGQKKPEPKIDYDSWDTGRLILALAGTFQWQKERVKMIKEQLNQRGKSKDLMATAFLNDFDKLNTGGTRGSVMGRVNNWLKDFKSKRSMNETNNRDQDGRKKPELTKL